MSAPPDLSMLDAAEQPIIAGLVLCRRIAGRAARYVPQLAALIKNRAEAGLSERRL